MKDEVDFSPADKRQRFLQIDTIILGEVCVASHVQITEKNKLAISLQYLAIFCMQISMKTSNKLILWF